MGFSLCSFWFVFMVILFLSFSLMILNLKKKSTKTEYLNFDHARLFYCACTWSYYRGPICIVYLPELEFESEGFFSISIFSSLTSYRTEEYLVITFEYLLHQWWLWFDLYLFVGCSYQCNDNAGHMTVQRLFAFVKQTKLQRKNKKEFAIDWN